MSVDRELGKLEGMMEGMLRQMKELRQENVELTSKVESLKQFVHDQLNNMTPEAANAKAQLEYALESMRHTSSKDPVDYNVPSAMPLGAVGSMPEGDEGDSEEEVNEVISMDMALYGGDESVRALYDQALAEEQEGEKVDA